ncbi:hypothetical protein F4818DRAFT_76995 [Hypoxylon cercidicola]|nr:hypothetical protein F4818DRAFT_76995 [Hypoxylon cercidicola]
MLISRFLLLPLAAALSPTPCVQDITWTVTGVQLSDYTTINPLSLQWDQRRTLDFHVSSPALSEPHKCEVDTLYYPGEETVQFDEWTYMCWKGDKVPISNQGNPDPALAFKFSSAYADFDNSEHPAKFALRQELECGSGTVAVEGSLNITMACGLPYLPNGCGPCLQHQCNGTTFLLHSDS